MIDLETLRFNIARWLEEMAAGLEAGRFRFCAQGSLVPTTGTEGQVSTCFATKIAWQTGIWDRWPEDRKKACVAFIKSFQRADGTFFDPWLARQTKQPLKDRILLFMSSLSRAPSSQTVDDPHIMNIRAETRQSASTLLMVGDTPAYPLPMECGTLDQIKQYIHSFDWSRPWSAGSHFSHLLFMLSTNQKHFNSHRDLTGSIDTALECLAFLRDPESGCWFTGTPAPSEALNGAMKVFSGLQWLDRPYPDCRSLLDFSLAQPFQEDGCGFLNQLFVVYHARKGAPAGYRFEEIQALGEKALKKISSFVRDDGAFSFFPNGAQTHYYGASVSTGNLVSDLHGTTMMTWAIALATALASTGAGTHTGVWRIQSP